MWRDFYHQVLFHHPHVVGSRVPRRLRRHRAGNAANTPSEQFEAWCAGRTGYPLVDAGMRQLNATGYMHNRLRMITASFLTKDLGVSWQRGEAWFALHLNDFELASNNGGWQWAASTGCDAQPWFRIFNPVTQSERFDPQGAFIRRWVPGAALCWAARRSTRRGTGGGEGGAGRRLSAADRGSRRGAGEDAGAVRGERQRQSRGRRPAETR